VYAAETQVRFIACSFYALLLAILLSIIDFWALQELLSISQWVAWAPLGVVLVYGFLGLGIVWNYRFLRSREVDTVFAACFANRKVFEELFPMESDRILASRIPAEEDYIQRQILLEKAWRQGRQEPGSRAAACLSHLVSIMKEESKRKGYLSSIYFAGADVDHPYFLKNEQVAIGLAVLPEDAEKAGQPKRHRHQVEVIFVLEGALDLHMNMEDGAQRIPLEKGEHHVIERNKCHWVTPRAGADAVYLFVKTNPAMEPREEPCTG